ncbi:hypothetical protein LTR78_007115 [Recurvomyces mirabilis]|uniref:Histone chaperone domain-containing protein n=1 Tax=Recurvomyces mirabilis TaxID=574656 RepID=A0AAE0WJS5_9PEZI|nr:hypothetical protein LTR78_007115 [Recurvomyces mirabilis]KAK5150913.1 hypothetical protein LTS14_009716 [Recurvomyces mirabilis]
MSASNNEVPVGLDGDNDYTSRTGQKQAPIPVQKDEDSIESGVNPATEDSDAQLEKDDKDAINKDNIVDARTRGAAKSKGAYTDPGDEEGLPGPNDGTSRGATEGLQDKSTKDAVV